MAAAESRWKDAGPQSDAFLAFGHFTDELPDATLRIKSAVLLKMASSSGTWQERQVILTKNVLLIAKLGSGVVSGAYACVNARAEAIHKRVET